MLPTLILNRHQRTIKKHLLLSLLGTGLGILIYYYIVNSESIDTLSISLKDTLLAALCGLIVTYVVYGLTRKLDTLLPWRKHIANRLLAGILLHFTASFLLSVSLFYSYQKWLQGIEDPLTLHADSLVKLSIILLILSLIYGIVYFALYSYYDYATFQIETVQQERNRIDLQLKALKSQLSPHFLFNSLNTISFLIFKAPEKAEIFIRRLAKMYQYTLDSYQIKLSSLEEELAVVRSYLYLLDTRFEKQLQCSIEIPETLHDSKIPPLALQMLVENAVKHNQLSDENPLKIQITFDGRFICVENNITQKDEKVTSFNIGLQNINARYLLLVQKGIVVSNGQNFTVKIPVIE